MDGRLLCAVCKGDFSGPWELMEHVQTTHMINIYELNVPDTAAALPTAEPSASGGSADTTGSAKPVDNSRTGSGSADVVAATATTATTSTVAATAAGVAAAAAAAQCNNIDSIIGLDAAAVAVKLHQHDVASDGSGLSVTGPPSTDGDDIDLNEAALLSPAGSSASIKDVRSMRPT